MLARALRRGGAERDPFFNSVGLLLPFDSHFNDVGPNAFTASITGSPSLVAGPGIAQTYFGNVCEFGGSDNLVFANNAAFNFAAGDFTIEMRFGTSASSGIRTLVANGVSGSNGYQIRILADGTLEFMYGASTTISTASGFVDWHASSIYYAKFGREAGFFKRTIAKRPGSGPFLPPEGWTADTNFTSGAAVTYDFSTAAPLYVGANRAIGQRHIGRIDELRITKGHWRGFGRQRTQHLQR